MAESVDALASGASGSNTVEVRVLFRPLLYGARELVLARDWEFKSPRHVINLWVHPVIRPDALSNDRASLSIPTNDNSSKLILYYKLPNLLRIL